MCECSEVFILESVYPDNKVHGVNMGPTWVLSAPDGPHVNFAIWVAFQVAGIQEWVGGGVGDGLTQSASNCHGSEELQTIVLQLSAENNTLVEFP